MKTKSLVCISGISILLTACEKPKETPPEPVEIDPISDDLKKSDMPILPIKKGDFWKYRVRVEIPPGITSEEGAAVDLETEKTRTFLGKVKVSEENLEVETFEVVVPGESIEREFVKIREDSVLILGSYRLGVEGSKPVWLNPPVAFVVAGSRAGLNMVPLATADGEVTREVKVVARESAKVPAGEYPTIRLLMTGKDGELEIRKTTWFAPGIGIVKEEKIRYGAGKLLFREVSELIETNVATE